MVKKKILNKDFLFFVGIAVVVTVAMMIWLQFGIPQSPVGGLQPGELAPVIEARGWLNGPAPAPESLAGKVLVVDAWSSG
ncbi:MAG: hypothetical protein IH899_07785 [Planctomycetes bacterium]|nr:hypothetical protein [Planctomycetota bacterium]